MIKKIISDGQTGADRAALDVAIEAGVPHGGWIPKGRKTEAGPLPERYQLQEMDSQSYADSTEQNVLDSDGTLIFSHGSLTAGSALTRQLANDHGKPCLHLDLHQMTAMKAAHKVLEWVGQNRKNPNSTPNRVGGTCDAIPVSGSRHVYTLCLGSRLANRFVGRNRSQTSD